MCFLNNRPANCLYQHHQPADMASKTILLTGATGLIGRALVRELKNRGHHTRIVTRSAKKEPGFYQWNSEKGTLQADALNGVDVLVHLAGAGIADKRWTHDRNEEITNGRTRE